MPQDNTGRVNIVIVGAGKAGELIAIGIAKQEEGAFQVIGFIDDDPAKQGKSIEGIEVLGTVADLPAIVGRHEIKEIFIAVPSERGKTIRKIIESTSNLRITYKILPRLSEVLIQDYDQDYLKYIRRVKAEDLLGGEILKSDQQGITDYAEGQVIMVTGAAGSIGSELSRQLAAHKPKKIIFYDWWENGMFNLRNQLISTYPERTFEFIIGDVKDRKKLNQIMSKYKPTTVFHAAAYKHVPLMENNPAEAIKNNILGTKTAAEVAIRNEVKKFILVSTDKAVNPTNIMGATKRAAEKIIHILSKSQSTTVLCAVRFGNVINSNGSAIPTFEQQIEQGGPVTVTHKEVTRFFMTIPEAVHLILQSWVMGENNDLFVLDMGESVKIYELARLLIAMHGYVPEQDIQIKIVGLRPGEKLYEEVLVDEEEIKSTSISKVFRTQNHMKFDALVFQSTLTLLLEDVQDGIIDRAHIVESMKAMISTYHPIN